MQLDKSENAGIRLARQISDIELQVIKNRKAVLKNAINNKQLGFKNAVISQLDKFQEQNMKIISKYIPQLETLIEEEITANVKAGKKAVEKTVDFYKQQKTMDIREPEQGYDKELINKNIINTTTAVLGVLIAITTSAQQQLNTIAIQVDTSAEDLVAEVERAQIPFLNKGISGKLYQQKEAFAETEFIMRDESHKTLLEAQGETAKQYGLQPLIQVSAHPSSCPLCVPWQGRILVDDVYQGGQPDGKHELLSVAIEAGLRHINCRHNWVNYVEGLDKPNLFENEKQDKITTARNYVTEQQQRYIERTIRQWKNREVASLTDIEQNRASLKVKEWQAIQRELIKRANEEGLSIYRQYSREQIGK